MRPPDFRVFVRENELPTMRESGIELIRPIRENVRGVVEQVGRLVTELEVGNEVVFNPDSKARLDIGFYSVVVNPDKIVKIDC